MLYSIKGKLEGKFPTKCLVSVGSNGKLIFDITIPLTTYDRLPDVGEEVELYIYVLLKENIELYGFIEEDDRSLFEEMISLPGIGPGMALRVLSGMTSRELLKAIEEGDIEKIAEIRGLGRKRAERIAFELAGRLKDIRARIIKETRTLEVMDKAIRALMNLGLKMEEARKLVKRALDSLGEKATLEDIVRRALQESKR